MQEGAVVLAVSGDILYCNARFAALVGASLESVIGTRIDQFVHASDRDGVHALLNAGNGRRRSQLIGSDARTLEVYLSLTTTVSKGCERLNLIVTDLSELHEAHSNRDRAERDSRMKDEFLAMLAHDLRNPLGAISSAVHVLELTHSGGESESRARSVIARQVGHLSHLIDDLLDVEHVVSGKIQLNRRPLDMAEAARRAVDSVAGDAGLDRHIDISTVPVWVDGDAVRLEQVLTNLVTNAAKYTPAGSRIRVALRSDGSNAVLTVEDTGVGISPDLEPRRVLLIEDCRDAREMFRMMLELAGHVVYDAADGDRGLELLEAEHPDVAIIDIGLPGLDGYQVARCIRKHPNGRDMLLLALTGYGFPSDCQHSAEAGFDHHLVKPVDPDELARLLSESTGRVVEAHA